MKRFYHRIVDYLDERETPEALALFRIMVGLALLANVGATGMHGVLDAIWIDVRAGGYQSLGSGNHLVELLGGPTPNVVWGLFWTTIVAGTCLVLGLGGRFTALVAAQCLLGLSALNGHARGSYDALLSNCLWLLVLSRSTATWSLDARILKGRFDTDTLVSAWPRRIGILQLVIVYFATGIQKISAHWTPAGGFSALFYILQQPNWHRFEMSWVAHVFFITQVATAVVWAFELGAPLLLYALYRERKTGGWRRFRFAFVGFGVAMHLGILVFLEVGPFTAIIWSLYFCLFRPKEVARLATIGVPLRRAAERSYSSP